MEGAPHRPARASHSRPPQGSPRGRTETPEERRRALRTELGRSREILAHQLGRERVEHLCFPWGVAGGTALEVAREMGYRTAFADRWLGRRIVRPGDDPHRLMRLDNRFIFALPGEGRRAAPFLRGRR